MLRRDRSTASPLLILLLLSSTAILFVSPSARANSQLTQGIVPTFDLQLNVLQINRSDITANIQLVLKNALRGTNVTVVNTYISDPSVSISENISISTKLSVAITRLLQFSSWSNNSGFLTAAETSRLIIQNESSSFPNERILFNLFLGSNYTSAGPPIVTVSVPTYEVLEDSTTNSLDKSYLGNLTNVPPRISELFQTYRHVYLVSIILGHSTDLQHLVQYTSYVPVIILIVASLLAVAGVLRLFTRRGLERGDAISAMVTVFLFSPLYLLSLEVLIPSGESIFLKQWLDQTAITVNSTFLVTGIETIVVIIMSLLRRQPQL
jgi:hypothetical protein